MTTIAITGVSGYLGQRLLALLDRDERVARIVGIDVAGPKIASTKLEFHQTDVREGRLPKIVAGADVVVHLAFAVDPMRDEEAMRSVNVDGTRNVLEAVAAAPAGALVYPSSASVYGAHADNPFPIAEDAPLRPNENLAYAMHKADTERMIRAFRESHPEIPVTVLRCAIVLGANVENFVSRMFEAPKLPAIKGHAPPMQVLHEEDAAAALHDACFRRWDGEFNCAADGWMEREEMLALSGKSVVELPEAVAFSLADRAWRLGLTVAPPAELRFLMHPGVLDNAKLAAAGWRPRRSNREALLDMIEAHRPWVSLGRGRVRKADLAKGAAATLGLIAAVGAARRARRRR